MASIHQFQKRAEQIKPSQVRSDLFDFIRSIEKELAAYNQATIFEDSKDVKGKSIGFYSKATELITGGEKKAGDPFTLKDTGDFLEGIFAKVRGRTIFFDTTDSKKNEVLKNLLTDDIFGLQDDDLKRAIDTRMLPFLLKYYRKRLNI